MLDGPTAELLTTLVRAGMSMVVAGRPGAGKTTLLSCCVAELDPRSRVVVAEEVFEAEVPLAMAEALRTGKLGVMDYYNMQNIMADTQMRDGISRAADPGAQSGEDQNKS